MENSHPRDKPCTRTILSPAPHEASDPQPAPTAGSAASEASSLEPSRSAQRFRKVPEQSHQKSCRAFQTLSPTAFKGGNQREEPRFVPQGSGVKGERRRARRNRSLQSPASSPLKWF